MSDTSTTKTTDVMTTRWLRRYEFMHAYDAGRRDFTMCDFGAANLYGLDLTGCDFSGSTFDTADFEEAVAFGANFSHAQLLNVNFAHVDLHGANFTGANCFNADFRFARLQGADFTDANVTAAHFYSVKLDAGTKLREANLTPIMEDLYSYIKLVPTEVPALLETLRKGGIDGTSYDGVCACLAGTCERLVKEREDWPLVDRLVIDFRNWKSPRERWFAAILESDTPENSLIAKITEEWLVAWLAANPQPAVVPVTTSSN